MYTSNVFKTIGGSILIVGACLSSVFLLGDAFLGAFMLDSTLMTCTAVFLVLGIALGAENVINTNGHKVKIEDKTHEVALKNAPVAAGLSLLAALGCLIAGIAYTSLYEQIYIQSVSYMFAEAIGLTSTLAPSEAIAVVDFGIALGSIALGVALMMTGSSISKFASTTEVDLHK